MTDPTPTRRHRPARTPMAVVWLGCGVASVIGAVVLASVVGGTPAHPAGGGQGAVLAADPGGSRYAATYALGCERDSRGVNSGTVDGASPVEDRMAAAKRWAAGSGLAQRFPGMTASLEGSGERSVVLLSDGSDPVAAVEFRRTPSGWVLSTLRYC